jgi:hypothetical protein
MRYPHSMIEIASAVIFVSDIAYEIVAVVYLSCRITDALKFRLLLSKPVSHRALPLQ